MPGSDLYFSNKTFSQWLTNGFLFKREDRSQKDLYIELIDTHHLNAMLAELFTDPQVVLPKVAEPKPLHVHGGSAQSHSQDNNVYKLVNQLEIEGVDGQPRIPDGILYVNGLPLVVFEFKSAVLRGP